MKLRNVSKGWIHLTVQNVTIPPDGVVDVDPDLVLVRHAIDRGWLKKEPVSVSSEEPPKIIPETTIQDFPQVDAVPAEPSVSEDGALTEEVLVPEVIELSMDSGEKDEKEPPVKKKSGSRKKNSKTQHKESSEEEEVTSEKEF